MFRVITLQIIALVIVLNSIITTRIFTV